MIELGHWQLNLDHRFVLLLRLWQFAPGAQAQQTKLGLDRENMTSEMTWLTESVPQAFSSGNVTLGVFRGLERKREIPIVKNCIGLSQSG